MYGNGTKKRIQQRFVAKGTNQETSAKWINTDAESEANQLYIFVSGLESTV